MKLVNQDKISPDEIQNLEIVPHQNEHIQFMHRASETLADHLSHRPVSVAWLDAPLLIIGDEPVVLTPEMARWEATWANTFESRATRFLQRTLY